METYSHNALSFPSYGRKLFLLFVIVFLIGPPLNQPWHFCILLVTLGSLLAGRCDKPLPTVTLSLSFILGVALKLLPTLNIQEGHQVLITEDTKPMSVENFFLADTTQWAFSVDGLWQRPAMSRSISGIYFKNLTHARIGAINDIIYNFSDGPYGRDKLPFIIGYKLPPEAIGMKIGWQGQAFWPNAQGKYVEIKHEKYERRILTEQDLTHPLLFVGGSSEDTSPSNSLVIRLEKTWPYTVLDFMSVVIGCLWSILLLYQSLSWSDHSWGKMVFGSLFIQLAYIICLEPSLLTGLAPLNGGHDGIIHYSFARSLLKALKDGHILEALRGSEDIFYFMPGLRYVRAFELAIFGETNYGYTLLYCVIPLILYAFFRAVWPDTSPRKHMFLFVLFLSPVSFLIYCFGFSNYFYLKSVFTGYGETLAYACFLGGITLILRAMQQQTTAFLGHFLFFLAAANRPNLFLAIAFCLTLYALFQVRQGKKALSAVFFSWLGFMPIFLFPLHNWYFGHAFVLMTSSISIPINLPTPPSTYLEAVRAVFSGDMSAPAITRVLTQWEEWNGLKYLFRLPMLYFVIRTAFMKPWFAPIGIVARMAFILQAQCLFYNPSRRYAFIAWFLTFIVTLDVLRQNPRVIVQWQRVEAWWLKLRQRQRA